MICFVVVLGALLTCTWGTADAVLVDASTVRVNYYKNLYLSESQRMIECNSLALLANLNASAAAVTSPCNDSDSELLLAETNHCPGRREVRSGGGGGGQIRPLVSSQTSVVRSKTRNLSLENELTIRLQTVTVLEQSQKSKKIADEEEGKKMRVLS